MKTLFITNLCDKLSGFHTIFHVNRHLDCSGTGLDYPLSLLNELSKHVNVDIYSPPIQRYITTRPFEATEGVQFLPQQIPIPTITNAEALPLKEYDVVIIYAESMFSYMCNFDKIRQKKILWFLSSPQQILLPQYANVECDALITAVDKNGVTDFGRELQRRGAKWLPLSVDANRFYKTGNKKLYDVCLLGNLNPTIYPFRLQATNYLLSQRKFNVYATPTYQQGYVDAINNSRTMLTCSGVWKFPVMKYFEAMACGTLLLADDPLDADELGFKRDENYASLNNVFSQNIENPNYPIRRGEWTFDGEKLLRMIDHYVTCVGDRERVAEQGREVVTKRHTNEVRAKELHRILETL